MKFNFQGWSAAFSLPRDLDELPSETGGLYAFFLRFPSKAELGFYERSLTLSTLQTNFVNAVDRFMTIFGDESYKGIISSSRKGRHLRKHIAIHGEDRRHKSSLKRLQSAVFQLDCHEQLEALYDAIIGMFTSFPPIYIGKAEKQSLRTRVGQHLDGSTKFSQKLAKTGFKFGDLIYRFQKHASNSSLIMRDVEKILQLLLLPPLSED